MLYLFYHSIHHSSIYRSLNLEIISQDDMPSRCVTANHWASTNAIQFHPRHPFCPYASKFSLMFFRLLLWKKNLHVISQVKKNERTDISFALRGVGIAWNRKKVQFSSRSPVFRPKPKPKTDFFSVLRLGRRQQAGKFWISRPGPKTGLKSRSEFLFSHFVDK